jgi:hypothetical protein
MKNTIVKVAGSECVKVAANVVSTVCEVAGKTLWFFCKTVSDAVKKVGK